MRAPCWANGWHRSNHWAPAQSWPARPTAPDHEKYQAIGLPGYQFIQDPLDYESRVHHSALDTLDHMRGDDMRQIAVVLAGMVWQAAISDKELPRPPIPTQPIATDPFKVADPDD